MQKYSKWGKDYWVDLGERVGSTLIYGLISLLTLVNTPVDDRLVWTIVGLPTVLCFLKGLLSNMKGDEPSASVVDVTSYGAS
jgi:hypothetical protein